MLQQFLRTASDGWDLALASARNLFAEADLHADEVGGDFAGEAHRLGVAVSEVHELLREHFEHRAVRRRARPPRRCAPARGRHGRRTRARRAPRGPGAGCSPGSPRPTAKAWRSGCTATCTSARPCAPREGWKLVDFEGEPVKPLAERRLPDSPWRDVAGMLRSFDYAAQSVVKDLLLHRGARLADHLPRQRVGRAQPRRPSSRATSSAGSSGRRAADADEQALIDAYEADKAVYEVLYEARNRPTWLDIPLGAIERIGAAR